MMSYDKASPNAKIGCSKSNDPELLEQLVREGKTNREIALILDLDYGSVAPILSRYGIKRDPKPALQEMRRADRQHQHPAAVLQGVPKGHGQHPGPQKQYEKS